MENSPLLPRGEEEENTFETRDSTDAQEKQPLFGVDQKSDIAFEKEEAQQVDEKKRTKRRRRRLLWGLTGLALLAPVAFLGVRHLRHHHCHHYRGPPDDEIVNTFSSWLDNDNLTSSPQFSSFSESSHPYHHHHHYHQYHGYDNFLPESHPSPQSPRVPEPLAQLPFHKGEEGEGGEVSKHHHHHHHHHPHHRHPPHHGPQCTAKVDYDGSGTYLVDPAEFSNIKLLVKARGSHVRLIIEQDEEEDILKRKVKGDDDGDDGDDDKIRIQAKIFVDNERTGDKLQITETTGNGSYSWQLENTRKSSHRRRRHHRPCIKAFIRIRIPAGIQDLDSLLIAAPRGFIGSKNIKGVQFGQFKAALGFGVLHFSHVRAVSVLGLANIHGAVFLNQSLADAIALHTVSGLLHLTTSEAQNTTFINSIGGKLAVGRVKTPLLKAHSIRGTIGIHGVLADTFKLSTTTGTIYAGVHATSGFYARSLAGSIHAYVHYGDKDDDNDDYKEELEYLQKQGDDKAHLISPKHHEHISDELRREWQEDIIKEGDSKLPNVLAKSLKGFIRLAIAKDYEGRFLAASVIRRVEVDGDDVEFEKDTPRFKSGWVRGDDDGGDDKPLVVGKSVAGAVKLHFL